MLHQAPNNSVPPPPAPPAPPAPQDKPSRDLEAPLSRILTAGTALSAIVTLVGITLYLILHAGERLDFATFRAHDAALNAPLSIIARAASLDAAAIMQLGVLLLILTPIVRVGFTLLAFLVKRDWMYVLIAAIVFFVLCLSLIGIRVH